MTSSVNRENHQHSNSEQGAERLPPPEVLIARAHNLSEGAHKAFETGTKANDMWFFALRDFFEDVIETLQSRIGAPSKD